MKAPSCATLSSSYISIPPKERQETWGDKTPGYIELVPQLVHFFPARISSTSFAMDAMSLNRFRRGGGPGAGCTKTQSEWIGAMHYGERWRGAPYAALFLEFVRGPGALIRNARCEEFASFWVKLSNRGCCRGSTTSKNWCRHVKRNITKD